MELSAVPEALVTVRAARDKMRGKSGRQGRTSSLWKGQQESGVNQTQPNICRTSRLRGKPSQHVICVHNVVTGLAILDALDREARISRLGQMKKCCQIARTTGLS